MGKKSFEQILEDAIYAFDIFCPRKIVSKITEDYNLIDRQEKFIKEEE